MVISTSASCCGCSACSHVCPKHLIAMRRNSEGFLYPDVNEDACVHCGLCQKVCDSVKDREKQSPVCYAMKCCDDVIRRNSSSGGIFSLLAEKVLLENGVVFGAAFTDSFSQVQHISIERVEDLPRLRTSKYVQSVIGDTFVLVKQFLNEGRKVLYTGTPCQIDGLMRFLGRKYTELYTIDVICHGVPSPLLWEKYIDEVRSKHRGAISSVNFRKKKDSKNRYGESITEYGYEKFVDIETDTYMRLFLNNLCLRPSCYQCKTKSQGSVADITLGDFWGVDKVAPHVNDGNGTSLVVVSTKKGEELLKGICDQADCCEIPYAKAKELASVLTRSVSKPVGRDQFFTQIHELSMDELADKYCPPKKPVIIRKLKQSKAWKLIRPLILRKSSGKGDIEFGIHIVIKGE